MNVLEQLMMRALAEQLKGMERKPEEKLAHEEALAVVSKIDPARCRGFLLMSVQDHSEKGPNGEDGLELVCSMAGAEQVLETLAEMASGIIVAQHMQRHHAEDVNSHPLLNALLRGSSVESEDAAKRFSAGERAQH